MLQNRRLVHDGLQASSQSIQRPHHVARFLHFFISGTSTSKLVCPLLAEVGDYVAENLVINQLLRALGALLDVQSHQYAPPMIAPLGPRGAACSALISASPALMPYFANSSVFESAKS